MAKMFDRVSSIEEKYYDWAQYEKGRAVGTIAKHRECIGIFKKMAGDLPLRQIKVDHFDDIRVKLFKRNLSRARVASVIYAMRSFLKYARDKGYHVIDAEKVKAPTQERYRLVQVLTRDEIDRLVHGVKTMNVWEGKKRKNGVNLHGLRWKCLLEVLQSSGMRISEALSLNRDSVDLEKREAIVKGKGGKYRMVFFSTDAVWLIREYLNARHDDHEALFVTHCEARRWGFSAAQNYLERWRLKVDIQKHITFHTMRRSFASFIFYEKDIYSASTLLGHADLETTRRHYISQDWEKLREIHHRAIDGKVKV